MLNLRVYHWTFDEISLFYYSLKRRSRTNSSAKQLTSLSFSHVCHYLKPQYSMDALR